MMNVSSITDKSAFFPWIVQIVKNIYDKGFFHLLGANYFSAFFTFLSQLLVAWWLMPVDIGRIKILQTVLNIVEVAAIVGLDTSLLRLCSMDRPLGERKYLFERACLYVTPFLLSFYILLGLAAHFQWISNDNLVNQYAPVYLLTLIPLTYFTLFMRYLESLKQFKLLAKGQSILRFLAVLMIIGFTYLWGIKGYIFATVWNISLMAVIFLLLSRSVITVPRIRVPHALKLHWDYAKYAVFINTIAQISLLADIIIVNYLIHDRALVGQYSFATLFIIGFNILLITFQQMAIPYISSRSTDIQKIVEAVKRYNRLLRGLASLCLIGGYISVPLFVHFVFRGKYDASLPFFCILFISWFFRSFRILQWTALLGVGLFNWIFYISVTTLIINLSLNFFLVKQIGIQGAAWGQVISAFISMIIISHVYKRVMLSRIKINNQLGEKK